MLKLLGKRLKVRFRCLNKLGEHLVFLVARFITTQNNMSWALKHDLESLFCVKICSIFQFIIFLLWDYCHEWGMT